MLAPGTIVHGRYQILRQVGRGGMGAVYEATDSRLRCRVALKEMRVQGPEAAAAFEHEAHLLASLRHPVLPAVIDHFVDDAGQFLVMQFIAGEDLETGLRKRDRPFALADVLPWLESLLGALEYLHSQQPPVVHRDIKPANLKLTPDGQIVLLDFGLAKGAVGTEETTAAPSVMGYTPRYSPLEQIDGTGTDARSDIYALGATFYHLLTGVAPRNALARASALMSREPDPMVDAHLSCAAVPPAVAAVLQKTLALARGQRYASAAALRADIRQAVARPESAAAVARPETRARRIDAAAPSQAQVGARIDLIVQVRFPDSPRLGLEDWPSRRVPDSIEQTSEAVRLAFPIDLATGRAGSARLQVRVVAPDFLIEGQRQQTFDVPPDAYSQRLSFLLTAVRPGLCRINVEVYTADSVFLGMVPVETDVGGAPVEVGQLCVSNLVLSVIAREVAGLMAQAAAKSGSAAVTVPSSVGGNLADYFDPMVAGPRPASGLEPPAGPAQSADQTDVWKSPLGPRPVPMPPRSERPATRASVGAERPVPPAPTAVSRAPDEPAAELAGELSRARGKVHLARVLAPAAALVLVVTAGAFYWARYGSEAPVSEPSPQASTMSHAPAAPGQPLPGAPTAVPPSEMRPAPRTPAVPPPLTAVSPPVMRPAPSTPRVPPPPAATPEAALASQPQEPVKLSATSLTHPFISMRVLPAQEDSGGLIRLEFANKGKERIPFAVDLDASEVWDAVHRRRFRLTAVGQSETQAPGRVLRPGQTLVMEFRVLPNPTEATYVELTLVSTAVSGKAVRFTSIFVPVK